MTVKELCLLFQQLTQFNYKFYAKIWILTLDVVILCPD